MCDKEDLYRPLAEANGKIAELQQELKRERALFHRFLDYLCTVSTVNLDGSRLADFLCQYHRDTKNVKT